MVKKLSIDEFLARAGKLNSYQDVQALREEAVATENIYRELFARQRESWEIPEIDHPCVFLANVYENVHLFQKLPRFEGDTTPRCFPISHYTPGSMAIQPDLKEFQVSWECLTEGLLRFLNWDNVFCAGGAVSGCLSPLPDRIRQGGNAATRVKRRKYYHDEFLPGSDLDLFLYGLNEEQAEEKLIEIYDSIQAANPYEIKAFRSAHAITLISQYPFRHIQVILRLYNSPSEVLMGFDVDACAVGYNGKDIMCCPRTVLAFQTSSNTVDITRRSPSYEMRLAKYAQRGFEVLVTQLDRSRIDPFLYEKRFDQTEGLSRLLLLERLRTPLERLQYRLEAKLQNNKHDAFEIREKIRRATRDVHGLHRAEGGDGMGPDVPVTSAEQSNYSTVFLPWGPDWTASKIARQTRKKDKILNSTQFLPDGRVVKSKRKYKIHVCAVGTMEEVIRDPFPDDPPIPPGVPQEALEGTVRGKISWLVDNPGRQQIGSFHPITDTDWVGGAFFSREMEELVVAALADRADRMKILLATDFSLISKRDFLGRSVLHASILAKSELACKLLLEEHASLDLLNARTPNGRTPLILAAMKGQVQTVKMILKATDHVLSANPNESEDAGNRNAAEEVTIDIDTADWNVKMSALQYAVTLGHSEVARVLIEKGADARKIAVHKGRGASISTLSLLTVYASECGMEGCSTVSKMLDLLLLAGASPTQVDTFGSTCWHRLACSKTKSALWSLNTLIEAEKMHTGKVRALDFLDKENRSPLFVATVCKNADAVRTLLKAGAVAIYSKDDFAARGQSTEHYQSDGQLECRRFPLVAAARNADLDCLKAYLEHDVALANSSIVTPVNIPGVWDSNATETKRPMDILEELLEVFQKKRLPGDVHFDFTMEDQKKVLKLADDKIKRAESKRDSFAENSYEWMLWNLTAVKYRLGDLERLKHEVDSSLPFDPNTSAEMIKKVLECIEIVKKFGGTKEPKGGDENKNPSSTGYSPHRLNDFVDVITMSKPMSSISFEEAEEMASGYDHFNKGSQVSLTTNEVESFARLMNMVASCDEDAVEKFSATSPVCIMDCFRMNPFMVAILNGNIAAAGAIFGIAAKQYAHCIKSQQGEQDDDEQVAGSNTAAVDQLKRLNNFDIAAGQNPKDSGPSADQIRLQLEAAEAAAIKSASATQSSGRQVNVSPSTLLLHRAIVNPNDVPRLKSLKMKLVGSHPECFSKRWVERPTRLRAIEIAVIRSDVKAVRLLIQCAVDIGDHAVDLTTANSESDNDDVDGMDGVEEVDDDGFEVVDDRSKEASMEMEEEEGLDNDEDNLMEGERVDMLGDNDKGEEEEMDESTNGDDGSEAPDDDHDGGDEDIEDDDDDETENHQTAKISCSEMRYLVVGEASQNTDLGGMTLPQLAIAVGNLEVFSLVAGYGREQLLPRGAVALWKAEVEAIDDCSGKATQRARESENAAISCEGAHCYGHSTTKCQLWTGQSDDSKFAIMETPLQFALSVGTKSIARALMNGELDDDLLSWVRDGPSLANAKGGQMRGRYFSEKWLCSHVKKANVKQKELTFRLVRPTAVDNMDRNALFYSQEDMVASVVASGLESISGQQGEFSRPFLDSLSSKCMVTPLMAAASSHDAERVKSFVEAGCSRFSTDGNKWNAVHYAIPSRNSSLESWESALVVISELLNGTTAEESKRLLLAPEAEHTPFMLALDRGIHQSAIDRLIKLWGDSYEEALRSRDSDLNSVLHIAVRFATQNEMQSDDDDEVEENSNSTEWLLRRKGASQIRPEAENAQGVTPTEIAIESVSMIWDRVKKTTDLPEEPRPEQKEAIRSTKASTPRRTLASLEKSQNGEHPSKRLAVSFDHVQEVNKGAAERAKESVKAMQTRLYSNGAMNAKPSGKPAVFPLLEMEKFRNGLDFESDMNYFLPDF